MSTQPIEAVLIGAGSRGRHCFGEIALKHPHDLKFVAVAEPDEERRNVFGDAHRIPKNRRFKSYQDLFAKGLLAPACVNTTMDRMHFETAIAAFAVGYHLLLEKPMAVDPVHCMKIVDASRRAGKFLQICHTMRYAPYTQELRRLVASGVLGEMLHVQHCEHVAYWHMAHSFVRGNWGNEGRSAPMLLAKSCHDLDFIVWMIGRKAKKIVSFGRLSDFNASRVGPEIPERCTDGCPVEATCPYSAIKTYLQPHSHSWVNAGVSIDPSYEARKKSIETGPYGRCVYRCDNDVVDHQVVAMEFEGGLTCEFTMQGHAFEGTRASRITGTEASIRTLGASNEIVLEHIASGRRETITPGAGVGGHGGGDTGIVRAFVAAVRDGDTSLIVSTGEQSLESHLIAYAAEKSRKQGVMVDMDEYRREVERAAGLTLPAPVGGDGAGDGASAKRSSNRKRAGSAAAAR
ncbi:MAG: Gfo/Idh/MocA family protein [Planctomycetota bacterium]